MGSRSCALILAVLALSGASAGAEAAERCGPRFCSDGEACCNDTCGLCAPPGGACILPDCGWGRDRVAGRRPILPVDHPDALLGPRLAVEGGFGSSDEFRGGQLRALGVLPLGRQFRLRGVVDMSLARHLLQPKDAKERISGRDGALQAEFGGAWSLPTRLTWLQAALLADGVVIGRRTFSQAFLADAETQWAVADVEAALGLAVTASHGGVNLAAFVRGARQLSCTKLDCRGGGFGLWDAGASVDADGRNLSIPVGLLVSSKLTYFGLDLGAGVFWLGQSWRVGALWRSFWIDGRPGTAWPSAEINLRFDWLPQD